MNAPTKPTTHNADLKNLPPALMPLVTEKRWLGWRRTWRAQKSGKGKWTKPPFQPQDPALNAKANDPGTWGTYEQAIARVESGDVDGIGYALMGSSIAAGDLDHVRDPVTGEIDPRAGEIFDETNGAYVEVTVSGTGLRVIGTASGPSVHRKFPLDRNGTALELYRNTPRYITVSGNEIFGPCTALPPLDGVIDKLLAADGARA